MPLSLFQRAFEHEKHCTECILGVRYCDEGRALFAAAREKCEMLVDPAPSTRGQA